MKKGRHRRFEEARALKRTTIDLEELLAEPRSEPCPECGAEPDADHASWCLYEEADEFEDD
ncbi:MAG: hypothetical protein JJU45_00195 [Acidimicrobiia bacterium]|nr:hypothetical protein [Acidimicrobiia bacterium]